MQKEIKLGLFVTGMVMAIGGRLAYSQSLQTIKVPEGLSSRIPWDLALLSKPPAYKWLDCNDTVWSLTYQGPPYQDIKATSVFAYYGTPGMLAGNKASDKNLPGIVLVHGGGDGTAFREWVELWAGRGYAAIAMDHSGCTPDHKRLEDGGPPRESPYVFADANEPLTNQWPYHAVADVILAHSLLRSFPEVDANRTAITGISWGGFLTCIAVGLDDRFKAAVPVYGCGFLHENSAWSGQLAEMMLPNRAKWLQLYDPSNYVGLANMPMLFVTGTNDVSYPLDSYVKTYNLVKRPPNLRITVNMPHNHPSGWAPQEIALFIDQHLRGGLPLPVIDPEMEENGQVVAQVTAKTKLLSAALNYTTDTGKMDQRAWHTAAAELEGRTIKAVLPANVAIWLLTVCDERQAIVSGKVHIVH